MDIFTPMAKENLIKKKEGFAGETACILPNTLRHALQGNSLCSNLYLTDIGYYPKALYHNRERTQGCRQYVLIYCVHGSGWFSVQRKTYQVKPNHFFILPENTPHKYGSDPENPWTIYWVHFTGHLSGDYCRYLIGRSAAPRFVIPSQQRTQLFEEMIRHAAMINNQDAVIYANNCLYNFLASFKNTIFAESDSHLKQTKTIDACIQLMKKNLDKNLNLYDIAGMMDLSISHLSALFKQNMHDSPYNYYIFLKIQRACYLLWNTPLNIKSIAAQLGYEDPYHFSRVFKNLMGLSPKQFRSRDE